MAAVLGARRREVSLVDHTSFILMRNLGLRSALTTDRHFAEQGFNIMPRL
jgi:predicted nucleic acid-binding protein